MRDGAAEGSEPELERHPKNLAGAAGWGGCCGASVSAIHMPSCRLHATWFPCVTSCRPGPDQRLISSASEYHEKGTDSCVTELLHPGVRRRCGCNHQSRA